MTKLLEVEWAVGRTGIIAPRAVLEPVEIGGTVVTYATLHNPADIDRKGLLVGDQVTVYRARDVIPAIEAPLVAARTGAETPIAIPEVCPSAAATSTAARSAGGACGAGGATRSHQSTTQCPATPWTSKGSGTPASCSSLTPASSRTSPTCSP
ncbi:hypothetical protein R8Z50_11070 [Longispora sp. K20-0274]|uniref:hypothetical protein n=1 Tax=Longispora sp. K20-0274 TaxID=3088255 RepID=UPI00399BF31E